MTQRLKEDGSLPGSPVGIGKVWNFHVSPVPSFSLPCTFLPGMQGHKVEKTYSLQG